MARALRRSLPAAAAVLAGLWPRSAAACASCLSAVDGTREAYYGTTVLLIAMPLVALALIVAWLRRAAKQRDG